MGLESHRAALLAMWADALDEKDLTAAEREEFAPTIWRVRAIAEDSSTYDNRDFFALMSEFERAYERWTSAAEPDRPGPRPAPPEP